MHAKIVVGNCIWMQVIIKKCIVPYQPCVASKTDWMRPIIKCLWPKNKQRHHEILLLGVIGNSLLVN